MRRIPVVCFAVAAPLLPAPAAAQAPAAQTTGQITGVVTVAYRYAEALLDYAEAQNELGNTAEAIRAVNQVRARARRGTGGEVRAQPADLPATLSKLDAREAIYMERNWELAFEQKRWFDLVRRDGIEPGYFVAQLQAHDPHAAQRGRLARERKLFPVPQTEIDAMPSLTQNPGC